MIAAMDAHIGMLTLMLVAVAGLGVLDTAVLDTRERIHDLGILKALGMTPRQTVGMVLTSVTGIGLLAAAAGVPLGIALHHYVTPLMGDAGGMNLPDAFLTVYAPLPLAPLALGRLSTAVGGACSLPAGRPGRTRRRHCGRSDTGSERAKGAPRPGRPFHTASAARKNDQMNELISIVSSRPGPTPIAEIGAPDISSSALTYAWAFFGRSEKDFALLMSSLQPGSIS